MLILGLIFIILAILILPIAWIGRVSARGEFCRKCKFDLAGLAIDLPETKCPECGREIHDPAKRKSKLRKKSKLGLSLASIMFIAGLGAIAVGATGKTSVLMGVMPDRILLKLPNLGVDEALDELVIRVSTIPTTLSASAQNHAIKLGLEHQANLDIQFDPRWGEVLYLSCVEGKMSDEQAGQYIANLDEVKISMRDRVHAGSRWIAVEMGGHSVRNASLTGGDLPYERSIQVSKAGLEGHEKDYSQSGGGMSISGHIRVMRRGTSKITTTRSISIKRGRHLPNAGELLDFGLEYVIEVRADGDDQIIYTKTVRVEHQIEVIHNNVPIVPTISDPELAQQIAESLSLLPIQVLAELPEQEKYQSTVPALSIARQENQLKESISFRVFLRLNDPELDHQEEIEIGEWVAAGPHMNMSGSQLEWRLNPKETSKIAKARETIDRLIQLGKADVILRTDAALAEDDSEIDQVIDMVMIFEDVPVEIVESISFAWSSAAGDWVKGKVMATPQSDDPNEPEP